MAWVEDTLTAFPIVGMFVWAVLQVLIAGCAAPGGRQGTVEVVAEPGGRVGTVEASAVVDALAKVQAALAIMADQSQRLADQTQRAAVGYQKTDQSTGIGAKELVAGGVGQGFVFGGIALAVWVVHRRRSNGRAAPKAVARGPP